MTGGDVQEDVPPPPMSVVGAGFDQGVVGVSGGPAQTVAFSDLSHCGREKNPKSISIPELMELFLEHDATPCASTQQSRWF